MKIVATLALALALALCAEVGAQPLADVPTSILVKLTPAAAARVVPGAAARSGLQAFDAVAARFGTTEFRRVFRTDPRHAARHAAYGLDRWYLVALPGPGDVRAAVAAFGALEEVEAAEADDVVRVPGTPVPAPEPIMEEDGRQGAGAVVVNDPRYPEQWHYHNTGQAGGTPGMDIDLPEAWAIATGSAAVVVHINDTGIDLDHVDLAAALWTNAGEVPNNGLDDDNNGYVDDVHGWNYFANTNNVDDDHGHGTHCAGTIGAVTNNGVGVAGIAGGSGSGGGVRLMATKFLNSMGNGPESNWAPGIVYAADNGAVISSNSVTTWLPAAQYARDAIDYFSDNAGGPGAPMAGGLLIGAAANSGTDPSVGQGPNFAYDRGIAVAALDNQGLAASYTNYGAWVDVSAPGGDLGSQPGQAVLSTLPGDAYGFFNGTSMAAPHVAGVAALLAGFIPNATPAEVRRRMEATARDVYTLNPAYYGRLGRGLVSAHLALLDPPPAAALVTPPSVAAVHAGPDTTVAAVTVTNTAAAGAQDLAFSARLTNVRPLFPSDTTALGGGPDAYGYRWRDSDGPGGPAFEWLDISAVGTPGPTGDAAATVVSLPFPFPFYGSDRTSVRISTNGYLTFGAYGPVDLYASNTAIPSGVAPNPLIAPFWDNLNVTGAGQTDTYHDAANDRFIVQWTNVSRSPGSGSGSYTFQAMLYPSGEVAFNYSQMAGITNSATIGIEDGTGTVGLQLAFNQPYVHNGLTARITREAPWATLAGVSGTLAPGTSADVALTLSSAGLPSGAYSADLVVWTSDPARAVVTIPLTLTLGGAVSAEDPAGGAALALASPAPNPATGPASVAYVVAAAGDVTLEVFDVLGRRVATLVEGPHQPGRHVARWDAAAYAPGVYVVRLTAGEEVRTTRATVLR